MASYNIKQELNLVRQAGDSFDIGFNVPDILPLVGLSAKFYILRNEVPVIEKTMADIEITGQAIKVPFEPTETQKLHGKYRWVLSVYNSTDLYTIGRGNLELLKSVTHV